MIQTPAGGELRYVAPPGLGLGDQPERVIEVPRIKDLRAPGANPTSKGMNTITLGITFGLTQTGM